MRLSNGIYHYKESGLFLAYHPPQAVQKVRVQVRNQCCPLCSLPRKVHAGGGFGGCPGGREGAAQPWDCSPRRVLLVPPRTTACSSKNLVPRAACPFLIVCCWWCCRLLAVERHSAVRLCLLYIPAGAGTWSVVKQEAAHELWFESLCLALAPALLSIPWSDCSALQAPFLCFLGCCED